MLSLALGLYHRLPPPARMLAASLRGLQLRAWRYGRETERLVSEALARESWTPAQWRSWQEERLAFVLHQAATRVAYYRAHWARRRRGGDRASWEVLANWPVLEKERVRADARAFVADGCDVRRMFRDHTSGTTGKAIELWLKRETVRAWYALFEARCRRWAGVTRRDRWAMLGGQLITPVANRRPPFWVWNAALRQLYMSSYHLAPQFIPDYLAALRRYRVKYLLGYTSSLYALAQEMLSTGGAAPAVQLVITNAEPVFDYQRQAIAAAFRCPVRETYGMAETVAAASECEHGRLHLWPEAGWLEALDDEGQPARGEAAGELICTGLMNADMPLIRYRTGDTGALAARTETCACQRTLPALAALEGRTDDVMYTADGRRVGRLDPIFKAALPIREAQIIQESLRQIRVRYVPTPEYTPSAGRRIVEQVQARLGRVEVSLEPVAEVPRGRNGKFRAVVCHLPEEQRRQLGAARA